jgi:hypothetical protein
MLLTLSLAAWQTPDFNAVFKAEVKQLDPDLLPLQQGLAHSSVAKADGLAISILETSASAEAIQVRAGLLYAGIIAGCSCTDDPTPINEINEYCEASFTIDRQTGATRVLLLND